MLSATKNTRRSSSRLSEPKRSNKAEEQENQDLNNLKDVKRIKNNAPMPISPIRKSSRRSSMESATESVKTRLIETKLIEAETNETTNKRVKSPSKITVEDPFTIAKRAFHRSGAFKIVGRVEERAELSSFWYDNVAMEKGASIYVSGNPGTGKTALVDEVIPELMGFTPGIKLIKINCMMLKDPIRAFHEIVLAINDESLSTVTTEKNPFMILNALEGYFCSSPRMHVVVIDEVDQIGMKDPELLCRLLALPYLANSHVSIFGIANSMDLTERFLPRLKLLNCEPCVLHFPQYTVPDITAILCDRLERINSTSSGCVFIDKSAIELTARKVASTGDLRRALDMLRQSIDLAEDEYKLSPITSGSLVKISHVVKIMEKFGNAQSGPLVLLKSLNLHQKVILAAIVGYTNTQVLTVQRLYEEYCTGSSRPPKLYDHVTRSEFIDLISNLESMSLIGKSTESSDKAPSSSSFNGDIWKLKVYLLVPNELVKAMITQELPTIKVLFGI